MKSLIKHAQILVQAMMLILQLQGCQGVEKIIDKYKFKDASVSSQDSTYESSEQTSNTPEPTSSNSEQTSSTPELTSSESSIEQRSDDQKSSEDELQEALDKYVENLKDQSIKKVTVENNRAIQYKEGESLDDKQTEEFNKSCVDFTQADKVTDIDNSKIDVKLSWEGNYDFDLIVWQLGSNGEFDVDSKTGDFIFYNNLKSSNTDIQIMSDLRNNGTEVASMDLSTVRDGIDNILVDISYYTKGENENFENLTLQVYVDEVEYAILNLEEYVNVLNNDTNTASALLIHRDEDIGNWVVYNNLGSYAFNLSDGCIARGLEVT